MLGRLSKFLYLTPFDWFLVFLIILFLFLSSCGSGLGSVKLADAREIEVSSPHVSQEMTSMPIGLTPFSRPTADTALSTPFAQCPPVPLSPDEVDKLDPLWAVECSHCIPAVSTQSPYQLITPTSSFPTPLPSAYDFEVDEYWTVWEKAYSTNANGKNYGAVLISPSFTSWRTAAGILLEVRAVNGNDSQHPRCVAEIFPQSLLDLSPYVSLFEVVAPSDRISLPFAAPTCFDSWNGAACSGAGVGSAYSAAISTLNLGRNASFYVHLWGMHAIAYGASVEDDCDPNEADVEFRFKLIYSDLAPSTPQPVSTATITPTPSTNGNLFFVRLGYDSFVHAGQHNFYIPVPDVGFEVIGVVGTLTLLGDVSGRFLRAGNKLTWSPGAPAGTLALSDGNYIIHSNQTNQRNVSLVDGNRLAQLYCNNLCPGAEWDLFFRTSWAAYRPDKIVPQGWNLAGSYFKAFTGPAWLNFHQETGRYSYSPYNWANGGWSYDLWLVGYGVAPSLATPTPTPTAMTLTPTPWSDLGYCSSYDWRDDTPIIGATLDVYIADSPCRKVLPQIDFGEHVGIDIEWDAIYLCPAMINTPKIYIVDAINFNLFDVLVIFPFAWLLRRLLQL